MIPEPSTREAARDHRDLTEIGRAAVAYALAGLFVVLLHGVVDGVCTCREGRSCPSPGKHPRHAGWEKQATDNPGMAAGLWSRYGESANVGIALERSGLALIDIDSPEGEAILLELLDGQDLPACPEARTRRGRHLYVRPDGLVAWSVPGALDLKVRGLVVAPPSLRVDGRRYEWVPGRELLVGWGA